MTILGIDTVAVVVSDRREALKWYRDILGLKEAFVAPNVGHWIEMGPGRPLTSQ
ncbi:MAG: VOC family protein [Thermoplasmata archaeon]